MIGEGLGAMGMDTETGINSIRPPAVAGRFYPADAQVLRGQVRGFVEGAARGSRVRTEGPGQPGPRAIIGPHAGYVYSGPIAGAAYAAIAQLRGKIDRVILLGPAHTVAMTGMAVPSHGGFATPLGVVPVDSEMVAKAAALPFVRVNDQAHQYEHGLEVHLPFLQETLGFFALLPVVTGDCAADDVATLLATLWCDDQTLVVVSSDLSHYHAYDEAKAMDRATADAIERLEPYAIGSDQACGQRAIQGLLIEAGKRAMKPTTLDLRSSGDTAGSKDRVVGYGAWVM